MTARDEVARLLVEHQWHDFTCVGWTGRDCGWSGQPEEHAGHLADILAEGGLLMPDHEHHAMRWFGAPADLPCEVCGETGWALLERMSPEMLSRLLSLRQDP